MNFWGYFKKRVRGIIWIGSNQSSYLNSYIEDTSLNRKDRKNRKNRRDIFFVAWLGDKKVDKDTLDRAIYFDISYRYLEYLKNYKPHQYIFGYIIRIFICVQHWPFIGILIGFP